MTAAGLLIERPQPRYSDRTNVRRIYSP